MDVKNGGVVCKNIEYFKGVFPYDSPEVNIIIYFDMDIHHNECSQVNTQTSSKK
jgi:hypothetical protein